MKIEQIIAIVCAHPTVVRRLSEDPQYKDMTSAQLEEAALIALAEMRAEHTVQTAELVTAIEQIADEIYMLGYKNGWKRVIA